MTDKTTINDQTAAEFLQCLSESGLSNADEARKLAVESAAASGREVAERLVAAGALTAYQATEICDRRSTSLCMGNYEILDRLGAGGMGTVFKARHRRMKRVVALKVLAKDVGASETFLHRFQREVEMIARLSHPNIVMAFDADEAEAGPFLVMEFVDGRDLQSEVNSNGPLSVADGVDCIVQAARGLAYAHGLEIIHRDIKPANLMRDVAGVVKVADLGLARLSSGNEVSAQSAITQAGGVVGTLDYMSPEQAWDSSAVDGRVDIYSLGCTLYFLLTGLRPYTARTMMALMVQHREGKIPSITAARPEVPNQVDTIFQRMVAKQPADRYATMKEVVLAIEELTRTVSLAKSQPSGKASASNAAVVSDQTIALPPAGAGAAAETSAVVNASASTGADLSAKLVEQPRALRAGILVEPSRVQAGIISRYLQQLGIDAIHTTTSGREALELAKRERAVVILSSMHLSDMTGAQLARHMLADPNCDKIGFVLATSEADKDAANAIPASPRVVLVQKPFDQQRLQQAIAAVTT